MIPIPDHFMHVKYNPAIYPGAKGYESLANGANCQVFAYAFLKHHGITIPPFRSSDLWQDQTCTQITPTFQPLDLLLFGPTFDPYGAHVAVYVGDNHVLHLSQAKGLPAIETIQEMMQVQRYQVLIGAKRVL